VGLVVTAREFVFAYNAFVLAYFAAMNLMYLSLLYHASRAMLDRVRRGRMENVDELLRSPLAPGVSVLVPAFNEQAGIIDSVQSLLSLRYPRHQVIVISDGSTDATVEQLEDAFGLEEFPRVYVPAIPTAHVRRILRSRGDSRLWVVDKDNGGKSDALNCGINLADEQLVCAIDADAILDPDALLRSCRPFVDDPELVVGTGGIVRLANGCDIERGHVSQVGLPESRLAALQVVEYLRAFLTARAGWSRVNSLLIVSGAFGVFRRDVMREIGGYRVDTVGEDGELVVRMHRHLRARRRPYRVTFVPDPVCWTEAPETLTVLRRQRGRWHRGLAEIIWHHRGMLCNPRYGRVGMIALPTMVAFELLGPVVELSGLVPERAVGPVHDRVRADRADLRAVPVGHRTGARGGLDPPLSASTRSGAAGRLQRHRAARVPADDRRVEGVGARPGHAPGAPRALGRDAPARPVPVGGTDS